MLRKFLLIVLMVCCLLLVMSCNSQIVKETPFKVGSVYYSSLQEACDAAIFGATTDSDLIVEIVQDATGPGIYINAEYSSQLPSSLLIDFGNHSYTVSAGNSSEADFNVSGVFMVLSGDEGRIIGSGAPLFSANNTQLVIGGSLDISVPDNGYLVVADAESEIFIDAFFKGSISGKIGLNKSKFIIHSENGNININNLELTGSGSQLIFGEARSTSNTDISNLTMDLKAQSGIPITTSQALTENEYDEIDKLLEDSGWKVHRHVFKDKPDRICLESTCFSKEYGEFNCTYSGCGVVDIKETGPEDPEDPTKHQLVHVKAVAPTATTSGIEECEQCKWCHRYFSSDDVSKQINPVLLATDNVPYSDMQEKGLDSLNAAVQDLEGKLATKSKTKGLTVASNILSAISNAYRLAEKLTDTTDESIQNILSSLDKINDDMDEIKGKLDDISSMLKNLSDGSYFNERVTSLNGFSAKTNPSYCTIIKTLKKNDPDKIEELKKILNEWVRINGESILTEPTALLKNALLTSPDLKDNLFDVYDYIGRNSTGFEKLSLQIRTSHRAYDMVTMLEGYEMVQWYFKYCYNADEEWKKTYRDKVLKELGQAWKDYKTLCDDNKMKTDSTHLVCWLSKNYVFDKNLKLVDYAGEIAKNQDDYYFDYKNGKNRTTDSIDLLIDRVGGECTASGIIYEIIAWYNKRRDEVPKNIYEILELLEVDAIDGTKLSECYKNKKYILIDRGETDFSKLREENKVNIVQYRMIQFGQSEKKRDLDFVGVDVVSDSIAAISQNKRIYYNCNFNAKVPFVRDGRIKSLGTRSGNKFYKLTTGSFTPEPYQ